MARVAKDVAAAAVLLTALVAVLIGLLLILGPPLLDLVEGDCLHQLTTNSYDPVSLKELSCDTIEVKRYAIV